MIENQITKIVDYYQQRKTRGLVVGKNTQLVLQEVFKFTTQRCIWNGKTISQHMRGRLNKAYCDRICQKRAWEFNNRLEKIRLTQPKFYNFCVQMLKEGIPADKLDHCLHKHRKDGFTSDYEEEFKE